MTTFRASLAGVPRIDFDDLHAALSSFIDQERVELSKRPRVQTTFGLNILVLFASSNLACTANVSQILNHDGRARGGVLDDSFREDMITVPVKTSLTTSQFLEMTLGRLASFGLKLALEAEIATVNLFPTTVAKKLTSTGDSRTVQAKVYPDDLINGRNIRLGGADHDMQPIPTIADTQVSSRDSSTRIFCTVWRNLERDNDTAFNSREAHRLALPVQTIGSLIVANWTAFRLGLACLSSLGFAIIGRFQSFSGFDTSLNEDVRPKLRILLTHIIVSGMMQLHAVLFVVLPSIGTNNIKDLGELLSGLFEKSLLLTIRLKKYPDCSIHARSIAYMPTFCQAARIFQPYGLLSFHRHLKEAVARKGHYAYID